MTQYVRLSAGLREGLVLPPETSDPSGTARFVYPKAILQSPSKTDYPKAILQSPAKMD